MVHSFGYYFFFFQAEDGIRYDLVTGVQTCALPIFNVLQFTLALKCGVKGPARAGIGGGAMKRFICVVLAVAAASLSASAQDFRGAITGRVLDSSNARLPGVTVTATNVATNVTSSTITNGEGDYAILFLNPGAYRVSAELTGFKKAVREGIAVSIGDRLDVNMTLDLGRMEETVSVTADSPLLATTTGSTGQVIGEQTIAMMPLSDGNPFALVRLAPGIAYNGALKFSRPFDNGGTSGIVTGGAPGANELSLH